MTLDPRRNLAATAAGLLGVVLFALPWAIDPAAPVDPPRLLLLAAAGTSFIAGAWPSRRVRFVLLLPVVLDYTLVGIVAQGAIGLAIMLLAALAAYALFVEYARERRA
jgi:hypothetical protein